MFSRCEIGLFEMSITRNLGFVSRPDTSVMALWEMYNSSRLPRDERPEIVVSRFD